MIPRFERIPVRDKIIVGGAIVVMLVGVAVVWVVIGYLLLHFKVM